MRPQSSQKTKKRWTITYIIVAIIELLHKVYITDNFKGTVNFIIHCPFMFTLYIYYNYVSADIYVLL